VRRLALVALAAGLVLGASPADAADPIMPLTDVTAGMHCTALSVIHGTDISSFNADVIDVVDNVSVGPAILIRVSGPAVDATGVGPGFSGSPIYCDDVHGVSRNVGAIAEGVGDYGNKLALVTPIEAILGEPVTPPASARRLTRRERASVRPLAGPLTITGLTPSLAHRLTAAARARGGAVYAAPAGPLGSFPPQELKPGASLSVGLSSGDVAISAIGTVTYTDGDSVWGFGHPLDLAGRRNLLLQDAYVYTVVNNPNGDIGITYKLAAPGHDLGTLTGDTLNAVTGLVGALPPITNLTIGAKDFDTGKALETQTRVADEVALGSALGASPLRIVAPIAVLDAAMRALQSEPGRLTAGMCLKATIAGHARVLKFCNRYVGDAGLAGPADLLAAFDVDKATGLLDAAQIRGLRVTSLAAKLNLRRGLAQAFLTNGSAPFQVRAGRKLHVTVDAKIVRGGKRTFRFGVPVPRKLAPGSYLLALSGPGPDGTGGGGGGGASIGSLIVILLGGDGSGRGSDASDLGPTGFRDLASQFAHIHRYDGVTARFLRLGGRRGGQSRLMPARRIHAYRNRELRIGGSLVLPVRVRRP
jgi:hypothetical protein